MKIDVLTLFPKMFEGFISESLLGKAIAKKIVEINIVNFRDYSTNKHHKVDDSPYGGGAGMVLSVEPVYNALISIDNYQEALKILVTPQGITFNQAKAYEFSIVDHIINMCGHYEGYDERIRDLFDIEVSVGDYVLTGGEIAAMVLIDSITRLIPKVINKDESHLLDSFNNSLLEHPHYTRPSIFMGKKVPEVLVNGNHKLIEEWREKESIKRTKERRMDLYLEYLKNQKKN